MRLDEVTAEIRPRSDWEAVDLGLALVRRDFWRCLAVWWLAVLLPVLLGGYLLWDLPVLFLILFWWWKPAASRMVLFEISRRLFGEQPGWKAVWREIPRTWMRRFAHRFMWARFSPWAPVTLAVEDLEGLRGSMYRQRCRQVVQRGEGALIWLSLLSGVISAWLAIGIFGLVLMLMPSGPESGWRMATESYDPSEPFDIPLLVQRWVCFCTMAGIALTDLFTTGAGFGLYINSRTWIEGWDVELAFKRMAQRLAKGVVTVLLLCVVSGSGICKAAESKTPAEVIQEVKAHPDFTVRTVKFRVPKDKPESKPPMELDLGDWPQLIGSVLMWGLVALLLGSLLWALWRFRHALVAPRMPRDLVQRNTAQVVMGMEVSSESLPEDIPTAAWAMWQVGTRREALALLYRGAISRVIEQGTVDIRESDTEGECLKRVQETGEVASPGYFKSITNAWVGIAYAGVSPADAEVHALCQQWPFGGRGGR